MTLQQIEFHLKSLQDLRDANLSLALSSILEFDVEQRAVMSILDKHLELNIKLFKSLLTECL